MPQTDLRIVQTGDIYEVTRYKAKLLRYGEKKVSSNKSARRSYRADTSRKSAWRAKTKLRHIVNANTGAWRSPEGRTYRTVSVTLTFKEEVRDEARAHACLRRFLYMLEKWKHATDPAKLKWVAIPERQEKTRQGVMHYHLIFFNLPRIEKKILDALWSYGFVDIRASNRSNVGAAAASYLAKHFEEVSRGQKRYYTSRGLHKPVVTNDQQDAARIMGEMQGVIEIDAYEGYSPMWGRIEKKTYKIT
jgi:hypothetical protein